jgi:hypothetical protein
MTLLLEIALNTRQIVTPKAEVETNITLQLKYEFFSLEHTQEIKYQVNVNTIPENFFSLRMIEPRTNRFIIRDIILVKIYMSKTRRSENENVPEYFVQPYYRVSKLHEICSGKWLPFDGVMDNDIAQSTGKYLDNDRFLLNSANNMVLKDGEFSPNYRAMSGNFDLLRQYGPLFYQISCDLSNLDLPSPKNIIAYDQINQHITKANQD